MHRTVTRRIIIAAAIAAAGFTLAACGTSSTATPAASTGEALFVGDSVGTDGCVKLTEHGAEYLTNDGYSNVDYYPVGDWYAVNVPTRTDMVVGGNVGPGVEGPALYAVHNLTASSLMKATTLNTQADQAMQVQAYAGETPGRVDPSRADGTMDAKYGTALAALAKCLG